MNDNAYETVYEPEEAGSAYGHELICALATQYHTIEGFIEARAKARRALLEALDEADPVQIVEAALQNRMPDAMRVREADESERRRKERGSLQDPMYPPTLPKLWD